MRDYLFRGKTTKQDEWVYGSYLEECRKDRTKKSCIFGSWSDGERVFNHKETVIPETVGQFTGLTDKNGKKIFEGDIVKTQAYSDHPYSSKRKDKRFVGIVEYYENKWRDENSRFRNHIYNNGYRVKKLEDMGKYTHGSWSAFWDCEVIGNIHDNPELLGEQI